jgi:hypothetical protein
MLESRFQAKVINALYDIFPGCLVLKNDEQYMQGIPDLTIFYKNKWAMLECKRGPNDPYRPNQEFYLEMTNTMSFSRTIYPENMKEVLYALQQTFKPGRSRVPRC